MSYTRPFVFLATLLTATSLFAGPIRTQVYHIGLMQNVSKGDVIIESIQLKARFEMDEIYIDQTVVVKNKGKEQIAKFGVPFEFIGPMTKKNFTNWEEFLFDFEVDLEGDTMQYSDSLAYFKENVELDQDFPLHYRYQLFAKRIPQKSTRTFHVHFHLKSHQIASQSTPGHYYLKDQLLNFSIEPLHPNASVTLGSLETIFDFSQLEEHGVKPAFDWVFPIKKSPEGEYTCERKNIKLDRTRDLHIHYDTSPILLSQYFSVWGGPTRCSVVSPNIKAASSLSDEFDASKAFDGDPATAWAEGADGSGIQEYVEFTLTDDQQINGLAIINGYRKNDFLYEGTNRVAKIKLDLFDSDSSTEAFSSHMILLEDIQYQALDSLNYADQLSILFDDHFSKADQVKKVRITILDVHQGAKFHDTCISEIIPVHIRNY